MRHLLARIAFISTVLAGTTAAVAEIRQATGRITLLRVHEVGTRYGPPSDQIDVEVVIQLDSQPGMSFGFQLREGTALAAHQGMLSILRDAFNHDWTVTVDFDIRPGRKNGMLLRAHLSKPRPQARLVEVPNFVDARNDPALAGNLDPSTLAHGPPQSPDDPGGAHDLMEETRWGPVEQIQLAPGASRHFQVPVASPGVVLVHASWTGAAIPPALRIARGGTVLAHGSPTPVSPDQGSVEAQARIDASGEVTVSLENSGANPASLLIAVGVLPDGS